VAEDLIRGTGNVTVSNCTLTTQTKVCIAPQGGSWTLLDDVIAGSGITWGPVLTASAVNPPQVGGMMLGCLLSAPLDIAPGTSGLYVHGNTITATPNPINIASQLPYTVANVTIDGNTIINNGGAQGNGNCLKEFAGALAAGRQVTFTNNKCSMPGITIGPSNWYSAYVTVLDPTLAQFTFGGNVYAHPSGYSYQLPNPPPWLTFCVGGQTAPTFYQAVPAGDTQN